MDDPATRDEHFRRLTRMYHSARINHSIPSCMTITADRVEVHMRVTTDYWHSAHAMHGSMYFKGLDDAAFFAANAVVEDAFVLTARFEVELLGMVTCESVKAIGTIDRREGRKIWARSELFDDTNTLVARGQGLFIVSDVPLTEAVGYADD